LALSLLLAACSKQTQLPEELVGTYTTSTPSYAGRYLELQPDQIVLGLGEAGASKHRIRSVKLDEEDGEQLYVVAYKGEGGTDYLRFFRDEEREGAIVLANQTTVIWTRQEVER
jgi:hypothetical protein